MVVIFYVGQVTASEMASPDTQFGPKVGLRFAHHRLATRRRVFSKGTISLVFKDPLEDFWLLVSITVFDNQKCVLGKPTVLVEPDNKK